MISQRQDMRRPFVLRLHAVLGWFVLLPALYMAITGITSALADQIERIMEPDLFALEPVPGVALPLSDIEQRLDVILTGKEFKIIPRKGAFDTLQVMYSDTEKRIMWINPYSGAVLADRAADTRLGSIIRRLHTGEFFGARAMAPLFAFALVCILISGLPYFGYYRYGRKFWHIQLGLASCPIVLFLAFSGIFIHFMPVSWLQDLHSGKHMAIRLVMVISLLIFILSLLIPGRHRSRKLK